MKRPWHDPRFVIQVHGAGQVGSKLLVKANEPCVIPAGEMFTIRGVHATTPDGPSKPFESFFIAPRNVVLTEEPVEMDIWPPLIPSGWYQNITASPANGTLLFVQPLAEGPAITVEA